MHMERGPAKRGMRTERVDFDRRLSLSFDVRRSFQKAA